jgi:hypothetical protein
MLFRIATLLLAASFSAQQVSGLYFYIDGKSPKCFFEELPKDTLVVGKPLPPISLFLSFSLS